MTKPFSKEELDMFIEKWCKALESGSFQQTREALETEEGFCCLGVSCYLLKDRLGLVYRKPGPSLNASYNGKSLSLPIAVSFKGKRLTYGGSDRAAQI